MSEGLERIAEGPSEIAWVLRRASVEVGVHEMCDDLITRSQSQVATLTARVGALEGALTQIADACDGPAFSIARAALATPEPANPTKAEKRQVQHVPGCHCDNEGSRATFIDPLCIVPANPWREVSVVVTKKGTFSHLWTVTLNGVFIRDFAFEDSAQKCADELRAACALVEGEK